MYKSSDTGATWTRLAGELTRTRVISLALDPQLSATVFAGTMGDGTYKSPDGGRTWHQFNAGIQKGTISAIVNQIVFNPLGTEMLYAATTVGVFRSLDGGRNWTERMQGMTEVNFVVTLAMDPQRPNVFVRRNDRRSLSHHQCHGELGEKNHGDGGFRRQNGLDGFGSEWAGCRSHQ